MRTYIGIDNGVTGTIGIITPDTTLFIKTPVFKELNYTRSKAQEINRIDRKSLSELLKQYPGAYIMLERPMINPSPKLLKTTVSAARSLEATLCVFEDLGVRFEYADSKDWQKTLLPHGADTKTASVDIGCRLFPQHAEMIRKHKDADGLLIAEYARQKYNK